MLFKKEKEDFQKEKEEAVSTVADTASKAETDSAAEETKGTGVEAESSTSPESSADSGKPDKKEKKKGKGIKKSLNSPKFKHGAMATGLTAGFIVIVILINVVVSILGERFPSINVDMTKSGANTLSEDALEVIDGVKQKTELYLIGADSTLEQYEVYVQLENMMDRIVERNSNISFETVDPAGNPGFMSNYTSEGLTTGDVLVRTEKRYRIVKQATMFPTTTDSTTYQQTSYNDSSAALANAISAVNSEAMPVIAVDTGHTPLMSVDGFTSELEKNNFEIKEFNLLTDEIPEGTQVIILPSPSADLTEAEVKKVSDYLNDDETSEPRNLVVLYTPQMEELPNLKGLMNEWGLDVVPQSEVTATSDGSYVQYKDYMIANATDEVDLGGQSSYGYLLAPMASPVEVLWDGRNEVTTSVLMTSPEDAERLVYDAESKEMETVSSGQENLIAMGTKMYKYASNSYRNSNVVAMGCGLFVDSSFLNASAFSNKDYAIDLFKYLTNTTGSTAAVASNRVELYAQDITMSEAEAKGWGLYTFMIGIPVAFLVVGVVVFFKRRHL